MIGASFVLIIYLLSLFRESVEMKNFPDEWYVQLYYAASALLDSVAVRGKPSPVGMDLGTYPSDLGGIRTEERFLPMKVTMNCSHIEHGVCNPHTLTSSSVLFFIGTDEARPCQTCKIFIFDCFSGPPTIPNAGFVPLCAGSENRGMYRTVPELAKEMKVDHIDLMKIDVEGAEWDILPRMLAERIMLPQQLLFKLYLCEGTMRARGTFEVALLAAMLYNAGYRVVYENHVNAKCREFTATRV